MDCSLPGSSVHGILQARIFEWVAMPSSGEIFPTQDGTHVSYNSCISRQVLFKGFLCGSAGKESACSAGDLGSIPGLGRSPEEGKGFPLQYYGLENSMDSPWGLKESDKTEPLSLRFTPLHFFFTRSTTREAQIILTVFLLKYILQLKQWLSHKTELRYSKSHERGILTNEVQNTVFSFIYEFCHFPCP